MAEQFADDARGLPANGENGALPADADREAKRAAALLKAKESLITSLAGGDFSMIEI